MTEADALLDALDGVAYTLDADGVVTGWNAAAERILGFSRTEAIGRPLPTIVPGSEAEHRDAIARALGGQRLRCVQRHRRRGGASIDLHVAIRPLCSGDEVRGVAVISERTGEPCRVLSTGVGSCELALTQHCCHQAQSRRTVLVRSGPCSRCIATVCGEQLQRESLRERL
jgi:PAS domain S-box-containing protein